MAKDFILVIDEGTTGVRAIVFNRSMQSVGEAYRKLNIVFPSPGKHECDALEIYDQALVVCKEALEKANVTVDDVAGIGITNQRLTWVIWDKVTGVPLRNSVTWLDQRGAAQKDKWRQNEWLNTNLPGLVDMLPNSYLPLVLDNVRDTEPEFKAAFDKGGVLYGTIDTWLIWKLTGGKTHATVVSNVTAGSIHPAKDMQWSKMMTFGGLTPEHLPQILEEADDFGVTEKSIFGVEIPICSAVADQQSALFSQGCLDPDSVKCTTGTGSFLDANVGTTHRAVPGLLDMAAWKLNGVTSYLLEGYLPTAGACLEWCKNNLELFGDFNDMEGIVNSVEDSHGVLFMPALAGFKTAPVMDLTARGAYLGITGGVTKAHMTRASLEAIGFTVASLVSKVREGGSDIKELKISGNVSKSNFIGQIIADIMGIKVVRPNTVETTALGAAELAAYKLGWIELTDVNKFLEVEREFVPGDRAEKTKAEYQRWLNAVPRVTNWE